MRPRIIIWFADGQWHARSDDPHQGYVSATAEIVLRVVRDWMALDLETGEA